MVILSNKLRKAPLTIRKPPWPGSGGSGGSGGQV